MNFYIEIPKHLISSAAEVLQELVGEVLPLKTLKVDKLCDRRSLSHRNGIE